jgi:hypothetical protein
VDLGHVQSLLVSVLASTTVSERAAPETDYRQAPTTSTGPTISSTTDNMVPANVLICRDPLVGTTVGGRVFPPRQDDR